MLISCSITNDFFVMTSAADNTLERELKTFEVWRTVYWLLRNSFIRAYNLTKCNIYHVNIKLEGSRDGAAMRALAFLKCGQASYAGRVCCWFSSLLRVFRFSTFHKKEHFQIPIRSEIHGPKAYSFNPRRV